MTERLDRLRTGGLYSCCIKTVNDLYPNGPAAIAEEGQVLHCEHHPDDPTHRIIFRAGAWQLMHDLLIY